MFMYVHTMIIKNTTRNYIHIYCIASPENGLLLFAPPNQAMYITKTNKKNDNASTTWFYAITEPTYDRIIVKNYLINEVRCLMISMYHSIYNKMTMYLF
jgi:hypothetical protein